MPAGNDGGRDRTRLTGFLNLVMTRDFWHQDLDQWLTAERAFTGVRSIHLHSPGGLETCWTRSSSQRDFLKGDWHRRRRIPRAFLHNDVATALANLRETFRFENLANFAARQDAKLTQPAPQLGSRTPRPGIDEQFQMNQPTRRTTRALRSDSFGRLQPCRPGSRCPAPAKSHVDLVLALDDGCQSASGLHEPDCTPDA
jgi:hypothetical protein